MRPVLPEQAWEDYLVWQKTDPKIARRVHELIKDTIRHPFEGFGKPEPLRHALSGHWSRRITEVHRMVYRVVGQDLWNAQPRYHY